MKRQSKSADVFGRSWVVYQWLSVKHVIDPNYQNLLLPSFFEFRDLLNSAATKILSENLTKTWKQLIASKTILHVYEQQLIPTWK